MSKNWNCLFFKIEFVFKFFAICIVFFVSFIIIFWVLLFLLFIIAIFFIFSVIITIVSIVIVFFFLIFVTLFISFFLTFFSFFKSILNMFLKIQNVFLRRWSQNSFGNSPFLYKYRRVIPKYTYAVIKSPIGFFRQQENGLMKLTPIARYSFIALDQNLYNSVLFFWNDMS